MSDAERKASEGIPSDWDDFPFDAQTVLSNIPTGAITSAQRVTELEQALLQLNRRKAPGHLIKIMAKYLPADARVGSIGFFTTP